MQAPLDVSKSCKYHEHTIDGTPRHKTKHQCTPDKSILAAADPVVEHSSAVTSTRQTERLASNDFELKV